MRRAVRDGAIVPAGGGTTAISAHTSPRSRAVTRRRRPVTATASRSNPDSRACAASSSRAHRRAPRASATSAARGASGVVSSDRSAASALAGRPDRRARSRDTHPSARSAIAACSANRSNGTPSALAAAGPGGPAASRSDCLASTTYSAWRHTRSTSAPPTKSRRHPVPTCRTRSVAPCQSTNVSTRRRRTTAVITARLAKPREVQPRSGRRHDANRRHRRAVVHHGRDRPAGQRRRLALERHVHVLAVAPADLVQRQRRGAESLGAARQPRDLRPHGRQVALQHPEHGALPGRSGAW